MYLRDVSEQYSQVIELLSDILTLAEDRTMAVVKFIPFRNSQSGGGLFGSTKYCKQEHKTWDAAMQRQLVTGVSCVANTAYREFVDTKRCYEKAEGRMYYYVLQSFSPVEEITTENAHLRQL